MELNCPSCQQRLSIPDQYAGQMMKCPMCANTFTAPGAQSQAAQTAAPPLAPPPPSAPSSRRTPAPAPPPAPPQQEAVWGPPEEFLDVPPETTAPAEYRHRLSLWLSGRVLQWVPPAALFVILVFTIFPWVTTTGGIVSQNAWQAAFASYSVDEDFKNGWPFRNEKAEEPGVKVLLLLYVLLLPIVLLLAIGAAVFTLVPSLPPGLQGFLRWRWLIVGGVALLMFLFLMLQLMIGFSMHNRINDGFYKQDAELAKAQRELALKLEGKAREEALKMERKIAKQRELVHDIMKRTFWLRAAFFLHLVAVICAAIVFWNDLRGRKPMPRIDLVW